MVYIEDKHLILQPKLNSTLPYLRLPLISAYNCSMCGEVARAAVKLGPEHPLPKINLYHENHSGLLVCYNVVPLNPANGERGALFIENGHSRPGKLSDSGRNTAGTCTVTKVIVEPDPLRRALQFFRLMAPDFPLNKPFELDNMVGLLDAHPNRATQVEHTLRAKGLVVVQDEAGGPTPAYFLRYMAWGTNAMLQVSQRVFYATDPSVPVPVSVPEEEPCPF